MLGLVAWLGLSAWIAVGEPATGRAAPTSAVASGTGCLACHEGIEDMHPEAGLSCVDCHGGDASATSQSAAHPKPPSTRVEDERVLPLDRDLAWIQFQNPMDLRVVGRTCATCHEEACANLRVSLHGTTAGHLSDGYYEMGLSSERGGKYGVFAESRAPVAGGAVKELLQVPAFDDRGPKDELATHYTDLPRKECMQCHLWSQGRAVRGRVGFDGDYRGAGCAACHVAYAVDGLSQSGDPTAKRAEPGHPREHRMTAAPTTQACSACHYGDASIGLHFRGLSQLPPNAPGGPEIPGTTNQLLNRAFYLDDPAIVPPDIHHEKGMHCIDCHTVSDVMGDGRLHGQMEHAVEISCSACHGTFTEVSSLTTERGTPLEHLRREGERVILTSKVDGREHVVPQVAHIVDPAHADFSRDAARAMTSAHRHLECYACHAGWNVNLLGFHFSRQEQLSQLDLISGKRTPGRVTTQEKVFATWKSFYLGKNERGAWAPYLTGFSTMGSVTDAEGRLLLDQVMPVTAAGLSGMTMIHHQPHSTRPTARACVECHRSPATFGLGSANFRLARQLAFVADRRGIEIVAVDRNELSRSVPLHKLVLPDVVDLAVQVDPLQGHATYLFAAEGGRGIHVIDVRDPLRPRRVAFVASVNPRALELAGGHLYVADGVGGLRVHDASEPARLRQVGSLPTFDAHDVDVRWPWAYVADGPGGLAVVDVRAPIAPQLYARLDLNGENRTLNEATAVESLFQYSRPMAKDDVPIDERTPARNLAAVLDRRRGLYLVDVTEPGLPEVLHPTGEERTRSQPEANVRFRGLALLSQVDLADPQGGSRTAERDYAYVLSERDNGQAQRSTLTLVDVSDPKRVPRRDFQRVGAGLASEHLVIADYYSYPTRRRIAIISGEQGAYLGDVTNSREPVQVGTLPGLKNCFAAAVEEFALDRMVDEEGNALKDVSHAPSRWAWRTEIESILGVPPEELGTDLGREIPELFGETACLHLETHDRDRSGRIEGDELVPSGSAEADRDGDGRVTLLELARAGELLGTEAEAQAGPGGALLASRTLPDGDLARLLDGVDPYAFDPDRNGGLSRSELERAAFAALDLDHDGSLTRDELSRLPGPLRELRYADAAATRAFRAVDRNGDGKLAAREFRLGDPEWDALDADHDGLVRFLAAAEEHQRERGLVLSGSEWPARRMTLALLPPGIRLDRLLAEFDRDGDEVLDQRELRARADLLRYFDADSDQRATREEIGRVLGRLEDAGVDALADDFVGRWDLDGSGKVEPDELPEGVRLRLGL